MAWQTVAQGVSISELQQIVADMHLKKGDRMKVIMDTPVSWAFDLAGAEWVFKPFVPDDMELVDVYGQGGQGIVELEADPVWLAAALAFIKAHWLAIIIAGFLLTSIITSIIVMVKVAAASTPFPAIALLIGLGLLAMLARDRRPGRRRAEA